MKKLFIMMLMLAPMAAFAQKFGHVNSQEVIQAMPEFAKARTEIEALTKQYEADLKSMQDEIYNAVKDISELHGYSMVLDRSTDSGIIYGSPKIDISNEVLKKLGYAR